MLIALLTFFTAHAAPEPIRLTCMTQFPTTTFIIKSDDKEVTARVINHNGSGYAPAISGVYTPNDIPLLTERANLVRKMSNDMTFHWPREKCKKLDDMVIQCFGTDDIQEGEGGAKFAPFALYSTSTQESGIAGKLNYISVALTFDVDGKTGPWIEMKYGKEDCYDTEKKPSSNR